MKAMKCMVAKSKLDLPMQQVYMVGDDVSDSDLYSMLYRHYGIRKMIVKDRLEVKSIGEMKEKWKDIVGYINLLSF